MKQSVIFLLLWSGSLLAADFEVASVKVNQHGTGVRGGCHGIDSKYAAGELGLDPPLGRCVVTAGRLSHLIGVAWQLPMVWIQGGPGWVKAGFDRFDVQAETSDPAKTTEAQLRNMLQNLLVDRFQLKFHRETVEQAGFALVVGPKGPRMNASKGGTTDLQMGDIKPTGGPVDFRARNFDMPHLAQMLYGFARQPVIDQTGLQGGYDLAIHWDNDVGPTMETAVREQLGLILKPQKVPVELFVIDSAQKPSAN